MTHPLGRPVRKPGRTNFTPDIYWWRDTHGPGTTADICRNSPVSRAFFTAFAVFLAVLFTILSPFTGARAQSGQPGIMTNGDLAVTGFSGTKQLGGQTFINTDGVSLKIFDVSGKGQAQGQLVNAPAKFEAFARDIGQVFGVALDNAPNPNIYVTSTSAHGLQIVIPDNNGDGIPERVTTGQPGAMFMDGQFGAALGGGPGSVWRIDGTTGQITAFADIKLGGTPNSGPGLGNIAFDPAHYQFYVSDLDTGFIHRLDLSGNDLGTFDHGAQGRPAAGLAPVLMNFADRMDITNPAFDSTDSNTWHLADNQRRVWGLSYFKGRLYYSVGDGPQIWSVGINTDGGFANDARVEIQTVPGGFPVSDILFTPRGKMVLAQRGGIEGSQDYTKYHMPKDNRVLRYRRDLNGIWVQVPEEYAIGFPADHRNASGGVALSCDGTLWSTGDALRNDAAVSASLIPGSPLVVHGLQGNKVSLVRPFNVPPKSSWFVDYDGQFADPEKAGHVGDVEVYRNCGSRAESFPGWYPIPEWYPPEGWVPPVWWPRTPDLDLEKIAGKCVKVPGAPGTFYCKYTIVVTNVGAADYIGQLHVVDNPPATATYVPPPGGSIPWNCAQPGGAGTPISCDSTNIETLHPGEAETLHITIQVTPGNTDNRVRNCAIVDDHFPGNNEDCGEADLPRPDLEIDKTLLGCLPKGAAKRCYFVISMTNLGGAPYTGPLHFVENIPAGTIFGGIFGSTTPGWACIGGPPVECTLPNPPGITLNPGDVEQVGISIIVPAGKGGTMKNCVRLGKPTHGLDPVAPGVNKACEPFTVPLPIKHECPAGWSLVPPGGAPAGWQVIAVDGINPDGTGWGIICMRPQLLPLLKKSPVVHKCPAGWTKVPPQGVPAGYKVLAVDGVNPDGSKWGMMCMKPRVVTPLPFCQKGETRYQSKGQIPTGWTWRKVTLGNKTIYCAKPRVLIPVPFCRKGETRYTSARQIPKGWSSRKVTAGNSTIYCAKPKVVISFPSCRKGETRYTNARQIPKGWSSRKVTAGRFTIYCAKPQVFIPLPLCRKGENRYTSARQIPKGWTWRKVTFGKSTIYCAKRRTLTPGTYTPGGYTPGISRPVPSKPKCVGGKLLLLKTLPPRWFCKCPTNWTNVRGTCKAPWGQTKRPTVRPNFRVKPQLKVYPKPKARPKLKVYPKLRTKPKVKIYRKLQTRPKAKVYRKLQIKPVTRLNRTFKLQSSRNGRLFR